MVPQKIRILYHKMALFRYFGAYITIMIFVLISLYYNVILRDHKQSTTILDPSSELNIKPGIYPTLASELERAQQGVKTVKAREDNEIGGRADTKPQAENTQNDEKQAEESKQAPNEASKPAPEASQPAAEEASNPTQEEAAKPAAEEAQKQVAEEAQKQVAEEAAKQVAEEAQKQVAEEAAKPAESPAPTDTAEAKDKPAKVELKPVIYWTKCFDRTCPWGSPREKMDGFQGCEYDQCYLTEDKSLLNQSQMLIFHHMDRVRWPKNRPDRQLYVHFYMDPPWPMSKDITYLDEYAPHINMTATYLSDANIHIPYGQIVKRDDLQEGPYVPKSPLSNRTRDAAWMVGHCGASSGRDEYAKELAKYIKVDIHGDCGPYDCGHEYEACFRKFETNYKFYLSFENQWCKDYFTEKLMNPLKYDIIPIALGMVNYTQAAPPHSVIDIRDFESPKELGKYLNYLSSNETAFNEYFQWKQNYKIRMDEMKRFLCPLCEMLHTGDYTRGAEVKPQYGNNYKQWFQGSCDNSVMKKLRRAGKW